MLFNSLEFLLFFPIVTLIYFIIPQKIKYLWLLFASYFFYMCWNPAYALLLLTSTFVTFISGILIDKTEKKGKRKLAVAMSFIINLAILFFFKYFYFTLDNINAVREFFRLSRIKTYIDVVLPVGISFYTFQALSYTVDVYRKDIKCEKNFFKYALFVSFFPQLVAGPIERSKNLLSQISEKHTFDYERVRHGLLLMLWGFFLKIVIADRAAIVADTVYNRVYLASGVQLVVATFCFAFQIYCDFASYSTIAKGAAKVMGFELMDNFKQPYFSSSIAQFWRNWHISLSSWFKDYLYIPLGGNKKGKVRKYLNLLTVFLASGLWHGANWHFVVWGLIHGLYRIIGNITLNIRRLICSLIGINREKPHYIWFQRLVTFLLVCFAWIFFRSNSVKEAFIVISKIFNEFNFYTILNEGFYSMGLDVPNHIVLICALGILFTVSLIGHNKGNVALKVEKMHFFARLPIYVLLLFAVLIFGVYGPGFSAKQFIYFQF